MAGVNRGRLIAFEGLDGCGKTTQIKALAASLSSSGIEYVLTREPTDGPMGQRIREMARSGETVAPSEELRWFMEDRAEHVDLVIEPALRAGRWVLTDRYYLSIVAYQGARGLDSEEILAVCERSFPLPDLALLFEISPEAGLRRVMSRGEPTDPAFEQIGFLRGVEAVFASLDLPYLRRVDANRSEREIAADVCRVVAEGFGVELEA